MRVHGCATAGEVAAAAAEAVAAWIRERPASVIGLPAGRTMIPVYGELQRRLTAAACAQLRTFNVDEFLGLEADHPGSFRQFLMRHLLEPLAIPAARMRFLDGAASDPDAECRAYEEAIRTAGGIDLLMLGIGTNGHVGFNEPAAGLAAATHRVRLQPPSRRASAALFGGDPARVPEEAISMGMGTILRAHRIVLIATGESKAEAVARALEGPVATQVPASFLQLHGRVDVYVDAAAASRLDRQWSPGR